jgi:DNA-directed RNA polymerase omega subunit
MKDLDRGRYTSEEAANKIGNRYDLILVATARAREIKKEKHGSARSSILTALEEIEEGKVGREYLKHYAKGNRLSRHHRND